jgi:uncharacterized protein with gpF-like domain
MINLPRLHAALTRFIEATQADKRDKALAKDAKALAAELGAAFDKQGKLFLAGMKKYSGEFGEAAIEDSAGKQLTKAQKATWSEMTEAMQKAIIHGLEVGGIALMTSLGLPDDDVFSIGFDVVNKQAVSFAKREAGSKITKINGTTKKRINSLIVNAVEQGWSYDRLSGEITERFNDFSSERATRIASHEMRTAYENGQRIMVDEVSKRGLKMEVAWLSARDNKVRASHEASDNEGWHDVGYQFSSGAEFPPTDPGCRCTALYRRKK